MYALVLASLVAVPLLVLTHAAHLAPAPAVTVHGTREGGLFFAVALVGTTVAPWQLFFQQSNVVDKRITTRFLGYERADTALGTILFAAGALGILLACSLAFAAPPLHGAFTDASAVARSFRAEAGAAAGALFAVALLVGSVLGASAITLATSYAVGDYFGFRHSLHRRWRHAKTFHRTYAVSVTVAASAVLVPHLPLGLLTTAVQALAGVLLPSAAVFLLLLCNDRAVLGPLVNPRWLNALTTAVVGILLILSALLTLTTAFPRVPVEPTAIALGCLAIALLSCGAACVHSSSSRRPQAEAADPRTWTMPPIESLQPPVRSPGRTLGLVVLRCYLLLAAGLLIARTAQIALASV